MSFMKWLKSGLTRNTPGTAELLYECAMRDLEKDGYEATSCGNCGGTHAKVLRRANGRVSAVCAGCGSTVFRVQEKS